MKNRLTFAGLILLSILVFSCKKENQVNDSSYFLRAQKNDINWSTTQGAFFVPTSNSLDSLVLEGNYNGEVLFIDIRKNNNSTYSFSPNTHFTKIVGGIVVSSYELDSGIINKIDITSVTNQNQLIEGSFTLKLKKDIGDGSFPPTIIFSNGDFKAKRGTFSL